MATEFQKKVKKVLVAEHPGARIICKQDGSVEVRHSYFYRHGMTAQTFGAQIDRFLTDAGIRTQITTSDQWNAWPKDSYFLARITDA